MHTDLNGGGSSQAMWRIAEPVEKQKSYASQVEMRSGKDAILNLSLPTLLSLFMFQPLERQ